MVVTKKVAFSQPASCGSDLECISINRCAFLKVNLWNFFPSMHLSQSVVMWQDRGGIQKIALFGKRPSPYYGKNSSNKQREETVHHYLKTWVSQSGTFQELWKFLQVQSQKPSRAMMKLALMKTIKGHIWNHGSNQKSGILSTSFMW